VQAGSSSRRRQDRHGGVLGQGAGRTRRPASCLIVSPGSSVNDDFAELIARADALCRFFTGVWKILSNAIP
jgi:hypothetical protein